MIDKETKNITTFFSCICMFLSITGLILVAISTVGICLLVKLIMESQPIKEILVTVRSILLCVTFSVFGISSSFYAVFLGNENNYPNLEVTFLKFGLFKQLYEENKKRWVFTRKGLIYFYDGDLEYLKRLKETSRLTPYVLVCSAKMNGDKVVKVNFSYFNWLKYVVWKRCKMLKRNDYSKGVKIILERISKDKENFEIGEQE